MIGLDTHLEQPPVHVNVPEPLGERQNARQRQIHARVLLLHHAVHDHDDGQDVLAGVDQVLRQLRVVVRVQLLGDAHALRHDLDAADDQVPVVGIAAHVAAAVARHGLAGVHEGAREHPAEGVHEVGVDLGEGGHRVGHVGRVEADLHVHPEDRKHLVHHLGGLAKLKLDTKYKMRTYKLI